MNKKKGRPFIINIIILTVITSILWVIFDVYRAFTTKPAPIVPEEILAPINPTLNQDLLNEVEKRVYLNEDEIPEVASGSSQVAVELTSEDQELIDSELDTNFEEEASESASESGESI